MPLHASHLVAEPVGPAGAFRRWAGHFCLVLGVGWLAWPWTLLALATAALLGGLLLAWALGLPASFARRTGSVRVLVWRRRVRRDWHAVCARCGLAERETPQLRRSRGSFPYVQLRVRPTLGQTSRDFEVAADALRSAFGAARIRIEPDGPTDVLVTLTVGDTLGIPFAAATGASPELVGSVALGRREDGQAWRLPIGPHTLVAGCSGAGKGSVFWSFAFALAPAVRTGHAQLHGIDLKGGMEIAMGRQLFTMSATDAAQAVAVLEHLVDLMRARAEAYAGRVRSHTPSLVEPLHVVMIDELAALTAYCSERDLQRRAETAINLLCSQGRAPGFMVFACLQDPRKEVIPSRGLFTQMVGLRLKDQSEASMVLGETAVLSGALCHRIPRDMPGTGYVLPEDGGHPIRVRAGFATDDAIREVAEQFATPSHVQLRGAVPAPVTKRPQRARAGGGAS
ncbi:cell division protein FtsK [Nocardioides guangzhouensis]|uniref:Cell division protein FtsK n=1 Tax=Nocardioides guangzhouensis TaxID=2497878 RepID=A0A4Q4ZJZ0_9ACTN|nr:FtsK/SpoIIIE domain-containing protein [Nocardioides guangzhouensis]RYP88677.1 cell division protein FtsK [Nocardioides guangzhouensis]